MALEECKVELIALCKQYYVEQSWQPHSNAVYKKMQKPWRRKVHYLSANVWGAKDFNGGDESNSKGSPMGY